MLRILPAPLAVSVARRSPRLTQHLPSSIKTRQSVYGYEVELDCQYPIEREMVTGSYDGTACQVLADFVKPGDAVMDIGANVGAISLNMARRVGNSGRVYAIEPGPLTHDRFQNTIRKNRIENISLIQIGLSKSKGELQWKLDRGNLGNAFLVESGGDLNVPVTTLDALADEHSIGELSFIKVDVEGMELEVFQGGTSTLEKLKPTLLFETLVARREEQRERGSSYYDDLEKLLLDIGYVLFAINETGGYTRTSLDSSSQDTLAIHSSNAAHLKIAAK